MSLGTGRAFKVEILQKITNKCHFFTNLIGKTHLNVVFDDSIAFFDSFAIKIAHRIFFLVVFRHWKNQSKRQVSPNHDLARLTSFWVDFSALKSHEKYVMHHFYRKRAKEHDGIIKKIIRIRLLGQNCQNIGYFQRFFYLHNFWEIFRYLNSSYLKF